MRSNVLDKNNVFKYDNNRKMAKANLEFCEAVKQRLFVKGVWMVKIVICDGPMSVESLTLHDHVGECTINTLMMNTTRDIRLPLNLCCHCTEPHPAHAAAPPQ